MFLSFKNMNIYRNKTLPCLCMSYRNQLKGCLLSVDWFSSKYARNFSSSPKTDPKTESDPFDEVLKDFSHVIRNPKLIHKGASILIGEFPKLYEEIKNKFVGNVELDLLRDPRHKIDMLYTFGTEESLNQFVVTTDSSNDGGYSSASLKLTQAGTAMFSGYISTVVPKTGDIVTAGYANFMCLQKVKSFGRPGKFDWRQYTHLVLKIRGDGRKHLVLLSTPGDYEEIQHNQYCYPLHTRGGPYWQIVKIPFSHFVYGQKGSVLDNQTDTVPMDRITKIGITVSGVDGPFKLEIDYIGLQNVVEHRVISPYESYNVGKYVAY